MPYARRQALGRAFILRQLHQPGRYGRPTQLRRESNVWWGGGRVERSKKPVVIVTYDVCYSWYNPLQEWAFVETIYARRSERPM